ncbi:MAG: hypothetical protein ACREHC_08940 [Candidatus Levyibacteriota bacterium]
MNEIRFILLAYIHNLVGSFRTRFFAKKVETYISSVTYFKKGDLVEARDGTKGNVWRVYVKIKTGQPVGCSVMWDTEYEGNKISPFLSAVNKSPNYNPIIRSQTLA